MRVAATASDPAATVRVLGAALAAGEPSAPVALALGVTSIAVEVTAENGDVATYAVEVTRAAPSASNPGVGDVCGATVALSGETFAVGALSEDAGATGVGNPADEAALSAGAVYLFR